jgi:UDP-glucose 4-epimerase
MIEKGDVCDGPKIEELMRANSVTRVLHLAAQAGKSMSVDCRALWSSIIC